MTDKVMVITGCSHAAGSEIDGTQDSTYNRQHSFGNLLADKLGYKAVNIAWNGSTNTGITRNLIEWFEKKYDPNVETFVLVGWTESLRIDVPFMENKPYDKFITGYDWYAPSQSDYLMVNCGYEGGPYEAERLVIKDWQKFMVAQEHYFEILTMQYILQLQYLFKMQNVKYLMCNTLHTYSHNNNQVEFYKTLVDSDYYFKPWDIDDNFYWRYQRMGYKNEKATYNHHGEDAHAAFAEELYEFIKDKM